MSDIVFMLIDIYLNIDNLFYYYFFYFNKNDSKNTSLFIIYKYEVLELKIL